MIYAASTTILRAGYINDPIWSPEWLSRLDKGIPILTTLWSKELGAGWATVLFSCASDIEAIDAAHHGACRVWPTQGNSLAFACYWAA